MEANPSGILWSTYGPVRADSSFLKLTERVLGSHPYRIVSVSYGRASPFHSGYTGSNPVGDCPLHKSCSGRFQAHAATLSSGYSWCRPPKVGTARTLCSVSGESLHRAACRRFGYRKAHQGICGFKVFRLGSPPTHCFWESYCPFTVHFYSARYRLARLQKTGKNDCMPAVIAFVYAVEMLSYRSGSATGNRTRVFRLRI